MASLSQYHRRRSQRFAVVEQSASIVAPAVYPGVDKDNRHLVKLVTCGYLKGVIVVPAVYPRVDKDSWNFVNPFMRGYIEGVIVAPAVEA